MFLRLTNLENLRLTVEHTLTVRENNEWNWVLKNRLFVTTVYQTGTQSNKSAGYRACSCLPNFFHLDRFGPRSVCEEHGMICQSVTAISFNISVILLILMYLLLKRQYIRKLEILEYQKIGWSFTFEEVSLPKHISISSAVLHNNEQENYHCHYTPARSLWCVCFTKDGSDGISLLKADYSISCLSPANGVYRKLVAACAIFPFLSFLYCFLFLFTSAVSLVSMMKFVLVL